MHIITTRRELIRIPLRVFRRAFAVKCFRRVTVSVKMLDLFRYDLLIDCWTVPGVSNDQLTYKVRFHFSIYLKFLLFMTDHDTADTIFTDIIFTDIIFMAL